MGIFEVTKERLGLESKRFTTVLVVFIISLPVLVMVLMMYRNSSFNLIIGGLARNEVLERQAHGNVQADGGQNFNPKFTDSKNVSSQPVGLPNVTENHGPLASGIFNGSSSENGTFLPPSLRNGKVKNESSSRSGSLKPTGMHDDQSLNGTSAPGLGEGSASTNDSHQHNRKTKPNDKLLGGLLAPGFDESSCLSRYRSFLYRKTSIHNPSSYLLSRLRSYEGLHKRCGPHSKSYGKAFKELQSKQKSSTACKYVVWIPVNGLGNRMISMAATFLYALLTNRILLVDHGPDMAGLFCEPFPDSSWVLPKNFHRRNDFVNREFRRAHGFGTMLKNGAISASKESPPSSLFLNLDHGYFDLDMHSFYCDQSQALLRQVSWLFLISDQYFVPSFFVIPSFKHEVTKMFPEKEAVFYHLGRYLFHPSNQAWGLITRFYEVYLAKADERIGLQIRVYNNKNTPFEVVTDQILDCAMKEKLLPQVDSERYVTASSKGQGSKAILITSLYSWFYENFTSMYRTKPTVTGEVIGVYQPSHEEYQHFRDNMHNVKAWTDMYLLSLCDKLVTSAWSTFGYVAQGLGGVKPLNLHVAGKKVPNPSCIRELSMEPCFHFPPTVNCTAKEEKVDFGKLVPYLKTCREWNKGVRLVSDRDEM